MLSLNPGSVCDVCAEEYGPHRLPHSIPCGHVLCASCCSTIVEKTAARLQPVCPFCRESFTNDSIRLIRLDFPTSGWSTPRRKGGTIEANVLGFVEPDITEEVTTLHKELQEWLSSDTKPDDQTSSLFLSAALLRAILMNHVAHSEANRISKHMEADLKGKLDGLVNHNRQLDAELRKERQQLAQKTQECNNLRTELSRLKALASTIGVASNSSSPEPTSHPSSPSPTPPATPSNASTPTMSVFIFPTLHSRWYYVVHLTVIVILQYTRTTYFRSISVPLSHSRTIPVTRAHPNACDPPLSNALSQVLYALGPRVDTRDCKPNPLITPTPVPLSNSCATSSFFFTRKQRYPSFASPETFRQYGYYHVFSLKDCPLGFRGEARNACKVVAACGTRLPGADK
ncbi:hypothetical protein ONZ45_g12058 [Pleurotus djamor]|nr:hypothetical protein ONZ45_g12058 [Pleurotus djamor]